MSIKKSNKLYLLASAALLLVCAVCAVSASTADSSAGPEYDWVKHIATYGDNESEAVNVTLAAVWQMPDGTYIAGGNDGFGRAVFGLDTAGNIEWVKKISGGDAEGKVRFVQTSPDGGVYLFTDGENIIKLDRASADAEEVWLYHLPFGVISSIEVLPDGNILMGGDFMQSFLIKVGNDGKELWNRSLGNPAGGGQFNLRSVQTGNDGKYIVTGYVDPIYYENPYRAFAMEINETGGDVWNEQYKDDEKSLMFTSIAPLGEGRYAVSALETDIGESTEDGDGEEELVYMPYIVTINENGDAIAKKAIDEVEIIHNMQKAADGGIYLFGTKTNSSSSATDCIVLKTDSEGNVIWSENFGAMSVKNINPLSDNSLLILGVDSQTGENVIIKTVPDKFSPVKPSNSDAKKSPGFGLLSVIGAMSVLACLFAVAGRRNE